MYTVVFQERGSRKVWWLWLEALLREGYESLKLEGKKVTVLWVCMFLYSSCPSSVKALLCGPASVTLGSRSAQVALEVTLCRGTLFISCFDTGKAAELLSFPVPMCCLLTWVFNLCLFAWFSKNHQHAPLSSSPVSQVRLTASRWRGAATASPSVRTTVTRRTAPCALTASSSVRVDSA